MPRYMSNLVEPLTYRYILSLVEPLIYRYVFSLVEYLSTDIRSTDQAEPLTYFVNDFTLKGLLGVVL